MWGFEPSELGWMRVPMGWHGGCPLPRAHSISVNSHTFSLQHELYIRAFQKLTDFPLVRAGPGQGEGLRGQDWTIHAHDSVASRSRTRQMRPSTASLCDSCWTTTRMW